VPERVIDRRPVLVTGHGRSGTHWLAGVLGHFVPTVHEPVDFPGDNIYTQDIVVDCRLSRSMPELAQNYRVVHLVRDGREVVRSAFEFYQGGQKFEDLCEGWASTVDVCRGVPYVRLRDLLKPVAVSHGYRLSHWKEWPADLTDKFWRICGKQMDHYGYER
jgi:hypothetical protein